MCTHDGSYGPRQLGGKKRRTSGDVRPEQRLGELPKWVECQPSDEGNDDEEREQRRGRKPRPRLPQSELLSKCMRLRGISDAVDVRHGDQCQANNNRDQDNGQCGA